MSQENVEIAKRLFEAANRRDIDALLAVYHPEVEWHPAFEGTLAGEGTTYRGHEGARRLFREINDSLVGIEYEIEELRDLGDSVFAVARGHARGRESGVEIAGRLWYVFDFERGKVRRARSFLDPREALQASGLSE